ncbi:MAG TPA: YihY/virulence factor BrkB family protein [Gemmatimonadales bacterium]|nr:YihY/virulence factor BrkB family protein [Gemmatimonadales bacterium]
MRLASVKKIVKTTLHDFSAHKVMQLSAALAYNAIFALAPFLLVIVGVAGLVLGEEQVRRQVDESLRGMLGQQSTGVIQSMMDARQSGRSLTATILGTAALLLGATGLFGQLQNALNTIWGVKPKPGRGIKGMLRDRFLSLAMVFGIAFLLLVSMVLSTLIAASSAWIGRTLGLPEWIGHAFDLLFSVGVLTVLFAAMFKFLPDVKIPWRSVWSGGFITALLFSIGKWALGLYLGRESTASAYGAAGSFVLILLWVYYASVIVFLGAELTQVVTRASGVHVQPTENAIPAAPQPGAALERPLRTPAETTRSERSKRPRRQEQPQRAYVMAIFGIVALVRWLINSIQRARA